MKVFKEIDVYIQPKTNEETVNYFERPHSNTAGHQSWLLVNEPKVQKIPLLPIPRSKSEKAK